MENKLREWLEKSGYPLELSAVKLLNKHQYRPHSSNLYQDYETDKIREIDIIANKDFEFEHGVVEFRFIIECKKSKNPFIILTHNKDNTDIIKLFQNIDIDNPIALSTIETSQNFMKNKETFEFNWATYDIGFKIIQGFSNSDETIYTAINSISKSFKYFNESQKGIQHYYIEDNIYCLMIPLLLIDAPFYKTYFNDSNDLQIEKINSSFISIKKPWEVESESNYYVPVVTLDNFDFFLDEIDELMKLYANQLNITPKENQLRNLFIKP